jgi:hypothetical protein
VASAATWSKGLWGVSLEFETAVTESSSPLKVTHTLRGEHRGAPHPEKRPPPQNKLVPSPDGWRLPKANSPVPPGPLPSHNA